MHRKIFSLTPKLRTPFICTKISFKSHVVLWFLVLSVQMMSRYEVHSTNAFKEGGASLFTYGAGYTAQFYFSTNHF